jgi:hypothetical protein
MEPPPRRPPALPEKILVRFPPDDPASLVRAVLVCKPWCRLVSDDGFHRRFRQFHGMPPLLGFVCHLRDGGDPVARFVPTLPPPSDRPKPTTAAGAFSTPATAVSSSATRIGGLISLSSGIP